MMEGFMRVLIWLGLAPQQNIVYIKIGLIVKCFLKKRFLIITLQSALF